VRTVGHTLVYGTGDSYGTNGRVADSVVVPFLRSSGVHVIDRLVIPRNSPAAGAGVVALLAEMPIGQILVGDPAHAADASIVDCASVPSSWTWDGVTFALGAPGDGGHACALAIGTAVDGQIRFLGDMDALVVESARDIKRPGELEGAPGGADRIESIDRVHPIPRRWLVVSGRRAQRSLEKYARNHPELPGVEVLASADLGAIRVPLDSARGPGTPEAYRAHRRTLWSAAP